MRQSTRLITVFLAIASSIMGSGCKNKDQIAHDTKVLERRIDDLYVEIKALNDARQQAVADVAAMTKDEDAFLSLWHSHQRSVNKPASNRVTFDEAISQSRAELEALAVEAQRIQALIKQTDSERSDYVTKFAKPH